MSRSIRYPILSALLLFWSVAASAIGLQEKVDLETSLQNKLKSILQTVDPSAYVLVKIRFNEIDVTLPGTGVKVQNFALGDEGGAIMPRDIRDVEARVFTKLDPVPQAIRQLVEQAIDINAPKKVSFAKFDSEVARLIQTAQSSPVTDFADIAKSQVQELPAALQKYLVAGAALALAALLAAIVLIRSVISRAATQIAQSMASSASAETAPRVAEALPARRSTDQPGSEAGRADRHGSDTSLRELAPDALVTLLKDCRRSHLKGYAKWLWQEVSMTQRQAIIKLWPESTGFISGLREVHPTRESFHEDPFYLSATTDAELDLADEVLKSRLKSDKNLWSRVSPMRKQSLALNIRERLELAAHSAAHGGDSSLYLLELTDRDEQLLAADPALREKLLQNFESGASKYPSWVWTLDMEESRLQETLQRYSAAALASAWIGEQQLLEKISAKISEKKLERLKELLSSNPDVAASSRNNTTLREISELAMREQKPEKLAA